MLSFWTRNPATATKRKLSICFCLFSNKMANELHPVVALVALLLSVVLATPIPSTRLGLLTGTGTTLYGGSRTQCCAGDVDFEFNSTMTRSVVAANNATFGISASCNASECACYGSRQVQQFLDLTPLYEQCEGGSITMSCPMSKECTYLSVTVLYVLAQAGVSKDGYWPYPLDGPCVDKSGYACATNYTNLYYYSSNCADPASDNCVMSLPLTLNYTGGGLLVTLEATIAQNGKCGNNNLMCAGGPDVSYASSCSLVSMSCP